MLRVLFEIITQGKSSFLIGGSRLEVEIKFEITNDVQIDYLHGAGEELLVGSIGVYDDVDLFGDELLRLLVNLIRQ